ncbi:MAG: biopolymer transporter ExbD [Planctomycetota bacterium]
MSARRTPRRGASNALTPLLDMLFLLLFALLATSRSAESVEARQEEEIGVELPRVQETGAGVPRAEEPLVVEVDAGGGVTLDARRIETPADLRAALEARATDDAAPSIELVVDGDTRHAVVADVLQSVRAAGVVDVRFLALAGEDGAAFGGAGGAR